MSRMFDNPGAFAPFFDDLVAVEGKRDGLTVRTSVRACALDQGFDDVLSEGTADVRRRRVVFVVPVGEFSSVGTVPQVGDVLIWNDEKFAALFVKKTNGSEYEIDAREA